MPYVSEIDIVYSGVCKLKLLLGNPLKRRVNKLLAGVVGFYRTKLRAHDLVALTCCTKLAVFAGRLNIIAEQLLLSHKYYLHPTDSISALK